MTRSGRIEPMRQLAANREQDAGRELAAASRVVEERERQLAQLRQYLEEYREQGRPGIGVLDPVRLNNYSAFLERLAEAVRKQDGLLAEAKVSLERCIEHWRERHVDATALAQAVSRLRREEVRASDRREQREADEAGQRGKPIDAA